VAIFVFLVAALWLVSVAYTAGGLFYSLRVLSPALTLLAVVGGYAFQLFFREKVAAVAAGPGPIRWSIGGLSEGTDIG